MDITQRAAKLFPLETTGEPYQTHALEKIKVVRELVIEIERLRIERIELFKESSNAADEIERLREALQDIALGRVGCNIVDAPSWLKEKE